MWLGNPNFRQAVFEYLVGDAIIGVWPSKDAETPGWLMFLGDLYASLTEFKHHFEHQTLGHDWQVMIGWLLGLPLHRIVGIIGPPILWEYMGTLFWTNQDWMEWHRLNHSQVIQVEHIYTYMKTYENIWTHNLSSSMGKNHEQQRWAISEENWETVMMTDGMLGFSSKIRPTHTGVGMRPDSPPEGKSGKSGAWQGASGMTWLIWGGCVVWNPRTKWRFLVVVSWEIIEPNEGFSSKPCLITRG